MTIDGRYHDATPPWLCIHKRWLENRREVKSVNGNGYSAKPFTLIDEDGNRLPFKTRKDAGEYFGTTAANISNKFSSDAKGEPLWCKINGEHYLIEEAGDDDKKL